MGNTALKSSKKKWLTGVLRILNSRLFVAVAPALITGFLAYKAAVISSNKTINSLRFEFQQQITSIQNQSQTVITSEGGSTLSVSDERDLDIKLSRSFDKLDWSFTGGMTQNKEGHYCPEEPPFPSWSMWTRNKYPADREISITFSLADKTDNEKSPTLYVSYGDKINDAPDTFYRFNIFDGDLNTLRLYDRKGDDVLFERSKSDAPLDKFVTFTISPVFLSKKSSILTLNPAVSYQLEGREYNFEPEKQFNIDLPLPSGENQGDGFQYGLGVSAGDCFKIISSNL